MEQFAEDVRPVQPDTNDITRVEEAARRAEASGERLLLRDFVRDAVGSLHASVVDRIRSNVPVVDGQHTVTFGTACSGSELYVTALPWVERFLGKALGKPVRFVHKWSCEVEAAKRAWIVDNFAPPKVVVGGFCRSGICVR